MNMRLEGQVKRASTAVNMLLCAAIYFTDYKNVRYKLRFKILYRKFV
jgi:hypothetical protein